MIKINSIRLFNIKRGIALSIVSLAMLMMSLSNHVSPITGFYEPTFPVKNSK